MVCKIISVKSFSGKRSKGVKQTEKEERSVSVHVELEKGAVTSQRINGNALVASADDVTGANSRSKLADAENAVAFGK